MHPDGSRLSVNRHYDPATGQFLSVDPLEDETDQPYVYTGADPVIGTDPSGMFAASGDGSCVTYANSSVCPTADQLAFDGLGVCADALAANYLPASDQASLCMQPSPCGQSLLCLGAAIGSAELAGGSLPNLDDVCGLFGGVSDLLSSGVEALRGRLGSFVMDDTGAIGGLGLSGDSTVAEVLRGKLGSIKNAPLPPGSPSWSDIYDVTLRVHERITRAV
jgi:hypothetical protein